MIYGGSGSGSYFGNVLVLVPSLAPVPFPDPDLFLAKFFNNKKSVPNLALSVLEAAMLPESWSLFIDFFTFLLHFMLDPVPECIKVQVPFR